MLKSDIIFDTIFNRFGVDLGGILASFLELFLIKNGFESDIRLKCVSETFLIRICRDFR